MRTIPYRIGYCAIVAMLGVVFFASFALNGFSDAFVSDAVDPGTNHCVDPDQYAYLADSLLHGRVWLDLPVPDSLLSLENPYDYEARVAAMKDGADPAYWDYAYFDGKYYCYFGVVPAMLMYAPYQLITGGGCSIPL